jgi:hypothetical protein
MVCKGGFRGDHRYGGFRDCVRDGSLPAVRTMVLVYILKGDIMDNEKEDIRAKMDEAAQRAAAEFQVTWTAQQVAAWMKKYYMTAGYKRLSRILMNAFGK